MHRTFVPLLAIALWAFVPSTLPGQDAKQPEQPVVAAKESETSSPASAPNAAPGSTAAASLIVYRPQVDGFRDKHPLYRPGIDKFDLKHPVYRPGIDRFELRYLAGSNGAPLASGILPKLKPTEVSLSSNTYEGVAQAREAVLSNAVAVGSERRNVQCAQEKSRS